MFLEAGKMNLQFHVDEINQEVPKTVKDVTDALMTEITETGNLRNKITDFLIKKFEKGGHDNLSNIIHTVETEDETLN